MLRLRNSILPPTPPPFFDGSDWKIKMTHYIKAIDHRAWVSVLTGENHPMVNIDNGDGEIPEPEYDYNSIALDAIISAVDEHQCKLISSYETAKEAWETLQSAHEVTGAARFRKLQAVGGRFEKLTMEKDETISSFYAKLIEIDYEASALGEPYSNKELVMKVLRSLPERFWCKVVAIEEVRDLKTLKLGDLIGSLLAYEMRLVEWGERKGKKDKWVRNMDAKKGGSNLPKGKMVQCSECKGYGHVCVVLR